jgi:orotate phosphoribosyltransferase
MIYNNVTAREVAEYLLEIKAVVLNSKEPFTWTSGMKSPIYCDNRKTLAYPRVRTFIKTAFSDIISEEFKTCDVIAGVATAGIPHGVLVADVLNLPFVYVRDKPKAHGLQNLIEGHLDENQQVVVIEDLFSTGGSSLKAVEALRNAGAEVLAIGSIFTYAFQKATDAFNAAGCKFFSLSDYPTLLDTAIRLDYIKPEERESLIAWYQDPDAWGQGFAA